MATLRFSFGTMGSGKSTLALQIHHNLSSRSLKGLLLTKLDEAVNLPEALDPILSTALPVSYVSTGQRVPEDLAPATPSVLLGELGRSH